MKNAIKVSILASLIIFLLAIPLCSGSEYLFDWYNFDNPEIWLEASFASMLISVLTSIWIVALEYSHTKFSCTYFVERFSEIFIISVISSILLPILFYYTTSSDMEAGLIISCILIFAITILYTMLFGDWKLNINRWISTYYDQDPEVQSKYLENFNLIIKNSFRFSYAKRMIKSYNSYRFEELIESREQELKAMKFLKKEINKLTERTEGAEDIINLSLEKINSEDLLIKSKEMIQGRNEMFDKIAMKISERIESDKSKA